MFKIKDFLKPLAQLFPESFQEGVKSDIQDIKNALPWNNRTQQSGNIHREKNDSEANVCVECLEDKKNNLKDEINNLKNEFNNLKDEFNNLKHEINDLKDEINNLENGNKHELLGEQDTVHQPETTALSDSIDNSILPAPLNVSSEPLHNTTVTAVTTQNFADGNRSNPLNQQLIEKMMPKVAVSFAGEIRERVEAIANLLDSDNRLKDHVFYDNNLKPQLAVTNLDMELFKLYVRSELVVVFLSSTYHEKPWTRLEYGASYSRRYGNGDKDKNTLMFIKVEDFNCKELALSEGDGYIDATKETNENIASIIIKKWELIDRRSKAQAQGAISV